MNRTETARETRAALGLAATEPEAQFPEFAQVKERFVYGEIFRHGALDERRRLLVTAAVLATVEGGDLEAVLAAALRRGVEPAALQEVFHQAAPYIGIPRAEKGLAAFARACAAESVALPLETLGTVTEETRLADGIAVQKAIFGDSIDAMRAGAPDDQKALQDYLSAWCFGDTYTRGGMDLQTRELLTLVCILALGGCDPQVRAHVGGNLAVGNGRETLIAAICQCLPYIGFPRTLNALAAVNELTK